jgi:hypothetical protein
MSRVFLTPINLVQNELQNARLQNLASAPATPVEGQVYYDSTLKKVGCYSGTAFGYAASTADLALKADASSVTTSLSNKADKATLINGKPLTGNITLTGADINLGNVTNDAQVRRSEMGVPGGVATLDSVTGTIPSAQLPSYVDDVLEFANLATFPATGEQGKIYVALDSNKTYRWSGSVYIFITSGAVDSVAGKVGVVTLTTADIASSPNLRYLTDAQLAVVGNTSNTNTGDETVTTIRTKLGITTLSGSNTGDETATTIKTKLGITTLSGSNTGDQTIALTGDVTGTGTGSFAATVSNGAITMAKLANMNSNTIMGNNAGAAATPVALTTTQVKTMLAITEGDVANLTTDLAAKAGLVANTFTGKQTFAAPSATTASIFLPNGATSPTTPTTGDFWGNGGALKWHNGSAVKTIAFTDSNTSGTATNVTGIVAVANGGTGVNTLTGYVVGNGSAVMSAVTQIPGADITGNISGMASNVTGTVSVNNGGTGSTTAAGARSSIGATGKFSVSIGNGTLKVFTINHGLNTTDIGRPACWETASPFNLVEPDFNIIDANNITVSFNGPAPTNNQYRIVIVA